MSALLSRPGRWLVLLRTGLLVFAAVAVGVTDFPAGYEAWAWAVVGFFALVTVGSAVVSVVELDRRARVWARALLIVCDGVAAGAAPPTVIAATGGAARAGSADLPT